MTSNCFIAMPYGRWEGLGRTPRSMEFVELQCFSEELQSILHNDGPMTAIGYRRV